MKYKVTTRGWIVFSIIGLVFVLTIYGIVANLLKNDYDDKAIPETGYDMSEITTEDETVTDSTVIGDSETKNDDIADEKDVESVIDDSTVDKTDDSVTESLPETEVVISEIDMKKRDEILFNKNTFDLDENSNSVLDVWVEVLRENESISITIEGHINGFPYYDDGPYGLNIAQKRAESIRDYLISKGVEPSKINLVNKGSSDQVTMKNDASLHYLNRRAVIFITAD